MTLKKQESKEIETTLLFGRNAVLEALKSDRVPDVLYVVAGKSSGSMLEIVAKAKDKNVLIKEVPLSKLSDMTDGANHQSVAALLPVADYVTIADILALAKKRSESPFILIADEIEDPHNLGALIRTADAMGVHGLILPKRRSASLTGTVYNTSAGAAVHLPVARVTNLGDAITSLKEENVWVFGADMDGTNAWHTNFSGAVALVIGSEGHGLRTRTKELCDFIVSIPMKGAVNSLNASVAGGILMSEIARTRALSN